MLVSSDRERIWSERDPMTVFLYALKSPDSKKKYPQRFKMFLDFLGLEGTLQETALAFVKKAREDPQWVENRLIDFIIFQEERVNRGQISSSTIPNYTKAVKLFCEMNRITLSWKIIFHGLPNGRKEADDRAPRLDEIKKLISYPDPRIKAIVLVMISSGIRKAAWDYLRWKHVIPTGDAARMVVYPGQNQGKRKEYYTFITPEAFQALKDWMDFRAANGEKITGESWVMRDVWQTTNVKRGANCALATNPIQLKSNGIKKIINEALWGQGIRSTPQKRHEWQALHAFVNTSRPMLKPR